MLKTMTAPVLLQPLSLRVVVLAALFARLWSSPSGILEEVASNHGVVHWGVVLEEQGEEA